ncbi:MAG TPA: hypothetical protein VH309_13225, partial [Elusimicrobiota bacterium]|nr:hypothetical protein [Elusimicrobiota bacterium]
HGDRKPEQEFRQIESFRKSLMTLVEEGMRHLKECERAELPYARLVLTAGEDEFKPSLGLEVALRKESWELDVWSMNWEDKGGSSSRLIFFKREDMLLRLKNLLDDTTGQWASCVEFSE